MRSTWPACKARIPSRAPGRAPGEAASLLRAPVRGAPARVSAHTYRQLAHPAPTCRASLAACKPPRVPTLLLCPEAGGPHPGLAIRFEECSSILRAPFPPEKALRTLYPN